MNRSAVLVLAPLALGLAALATGWVLAGALRPAPALPVAPIEMPSGGGLQPLPRPTSVGAQPAGPTPPPAGLPAEPAGTAGEDGDDREDGDDPDDGDDRDDDDR